MKITGLLTIIYGLEFTAALMATFNFKKYSRSSERYFMCFLWYTFVVEMIGISSGYLFTFKNFWVYNAYTITSFLFYFYWYYTILERKQFRQTVVVFSGLFSIIATVSLVYQSWEEYHIYTFLTGAFFVLVLTMFHFHQLLNNDHVLVVKYKLSFWISTALLLFYMGMIPLFVLAEYLNFEGFSYVITLVSLNLILYGCYCIGFLWTKKKYNHF
jgi:hypothetical protein